jgi:hypothetical protein
MMCSLGSNDFDCPDFKTVHPDFWNILLQGIGGTVARRLAIINGQTLEPGESVQIKIASRSVSVRCVEIKEKSVTITVDNVEAELFLRGK